MYEIYRQSTIFSWSNYFFSFPASLSTRIDSHHYSRNHFLFSFDWANAPQASCTFNLPAYNYLMYKILNSQSNLSQNSRYPSNSIEAHSFSLLKDCPVAFSSSYWGVLMRGLFLKVSLNYFVKRASSNSFVSFMILKSYYCKYQKSLRLRS